MAHAKHLPLDIVRSVPHGHVVDDVVAKLEEDLALALDARLLSARPQILQKLARATALFPQKKRRDVLMVMMGTYRILLNAADWRAYSGLRAAWLFDAWPDSHEDLCGLVHTFGLTHLFVTARQSALVIARMAAPCKVEWLPEPLVDLGFAPVPWSERTNSVIQFGRKHEDYHRALLCGMGSAGFEYRYEKSKGKVLFPSMSELSVALGRSKVSVCFPSDLTHPERAGNVSTMTQRYLQSMASGCLIIGSSPPEMTDVFGYDPVVSADMDDPAGQIARILENEDDYRGLIERNLAAVRTQSVAKRAESIADFLNR